MSMQLIVSLINLTGSSQRRVQKLKLIYGILYRISIKYFEFNLIKTLILQLDLL